MNTLCRWALAVAATALAAAAQRAPAPAAAADPDWAPAARWPLLRPVAAPCWLDDVVAVRAVVGDDRAALRDLDLRAHAVLCVPAALPDGQRLVWHRAQRADGAWRVALRAEGVPPPATAAADTAAPPRDHGALFLLPRVVLPVHLHLPIAGGPPLPVLTLAAPEQGELPKVLAVRELATGGGDTARSERATTAAEWRALRQRLGAAGAALPDDYADFAREVVVLVAPAVARAFPGCTLATATEEGVDVITVRQQFPSGRLLPERAPVVLLTLPRRPRQLAIVGGDRFGGAAATTLAVFEPVR